MRKGLIRILLGLLCIAMSIYFFLGEGTRIEVTLVVELFYLKNMLKIISFALPGIVGIVLFLLGLRAYEFTVPESRILQADTRRYHTVLRYTAAALSAYSAVFYLFNLFPPLQWFRPYDGFVFLVVPFLGLSALSLTVYLLFFYGRKPSHLLTASCGLVAGYLLVFGGLAGFFSLFALIVGDKEGLLPAIVMVPSLVSAFFLVHFIILAGSARCTAQKFRTAGAIASLTALAAFLCFFLAYEGLGESVFNLLPIGKFALVLLPMTGPFVALLISTVFLPLRVQEDTETAAADTVASGA